MEPLKMRGNPQNIEERLLKHRFIDGDCWIWTGVHNGKYGQIGYRFRMEFVHRISAMLYLGLDLDSSLQVNHNCPNTKCFNPKHLYVGTQSDNIKQAYREGTKKITGSFSNEWKENRAAKRAAGKSDSAAD